MDAQAVLDKLVKDLFHDDELGAVIRAHIRIESVLINFVSLAAPAPNHVKKLCLDFSKTVSLAVVLGLDAEYEKPLKVLGELRNDFAHKPDMKLSKSAVNNLYAQLNSDAKQKIQKSFKEIRNENESIKPFQRFKELPPTDQFRLIFVIIWAQMQSALLLLNEELNA